MRRDKERIFAIVVGPGNHSCRGDQLDRVSWPAWIEARELVANRNSATGVRVDNGQKIDWTEHEFWRVQNGRLAEQWSVADGLNLG